MIVRDISFVGNGGSFSGHNDLQLRAQMDQAESKFGVLLWPFVYYVDPKTFDRERLVRDSYRLEVWYAHHGWFDAKVVGWETRQVRRPSDKRAGVIDIRGRVEPGSQSLVREIRLEGVTPEVEGVINAALRDAPIKVGSPFDKDLVEKTRQTLVTALQNSAHPYVSVGSDITAHPNELSVDLIFTVDSGIAAEIGEVVITGNEVVDDKFIDLAADLDEGSPYKLEALRDAQRRLFEMGTFSIVNVEPDLSNVANPIVPVNVNVSESKFGTLRFGVGFDYDSYLPIIRASSRLRHVNLFHELVQADFGLRGGYAFDVAADFPSGQPIWGTDLTLEYPRLFLQKASLELRGEFEQDIYSGLWTYRRPQVDLQLVYRLNDDIQLRWGPHYESYTFLGSFAEGDETDIAAAQQRLFGIPGREDFRYQLTALDHFASLDYRDDPVNPTRGSFTSLNLRAAYAVSDAGFSFFRTSAEHKRYIPLRARDKNSAYPLTLALRGRATVIVPYGETRTIPIPERAFLGGSTSIRGFRPNQVGAYNTLCTYRDVKSGGVFWVEGDEITTTEMEPYWLPRGGNVAPELSAEVRYDWAYGVTLAGFVDTGILSQTIQSLLSNAGEDFRFSAGIGARYNTIVGPVRFDISLRPLYEEDAGPAGYTLCNSAADQIPRVNDFFSNFRAFRDPDDHPPLALVFFITFGESL